MAPDTSTVGGHSLSPRVVILVPRRNGIADRDAIWAWCRAWWGREFPDFPIVEGHHDGGPFNRSAAINRAAASAGEWDVAVIIDSDIIIEPENLGPAIDLALASGVMVMPFDVRRDLSDDGTARLMSGDGRRSTWAKFVRVEYRRMLSACVVVSRGLWDATGGFDEKFRGWGFEDNAFAAVCETIGGPLVRLPGDLWHLYHCTSPDGRAGSALGEANRARADMYTRAIGDPEAILAIREDRLLYRQPGIPPILHRVVPKDTKPEAEKWWAQFRAMHPNWTLMTHRDPLVAEDWPLTAPSWDLCTAGAQLADMVRLEALLKWGGVYVDQDMQPFRPLDSLLNCQAFAAWEDERCVPNAVMGAVPDHPAIRACLELSLARLAEKPTEVWNSGAGVTTAILPGRDDVLLLPPESFYPVHYRDANRGRLMANFRPQTQPWTFALHWYWGSWLPKK
jgi:hypothetical protein